VVACAGHSLGEYSALVAAGVLDLAAASRLVAARGAAMLDAARAEPGTMVAVVGAGADEGTVDTVVARLRSEEGARVWIANLNAPGQIVLAGDTVGIERAATAIVDGGVGRVLTLPVGGAFHSPLMDSARAPLAAALARTPFSDARLPVVANVDARPHTHATDWPDVLSRQLTAPVRWSLVSGRIQGFAGNRYARHTLTDLDQQPGGD
jgi:[acyl-carrier-protein] S-malonyltransferase